MFFFGKLLQPLLWPFNIALLSLWAAIILFWRKRDRPAKILVLNAAFFLTVPALPVLSVPLFQHLEWSFLPKRIADYPEADAIVVLGGTVSNLLAPRKEPEEMFGTRLVTSYRLWREHRAPRIILSSGSDYELPNGRRRVEAEDMSQFLLSLGVPKAALHLETRSRNTAENAEFTLKILRALGAKKILLVTSAFHMRRALPFFEGEEFEVVAVPTEHKMSMADRFPFTWRYYVPDFGALGLMTASIKEYVGDFVYTLRRQFKKVGSVSKSPGQLTQEKS